MKLAIDRVDGVELVALRDPKVLDALFSDIRLRLTQMAEDASTAGYWPMQARDLHFDVLGVLYESDGIPVSAAREPVA